MNKTTRKSLIEKYLSGETDATQEQNLTLWFASHKPDEDEKAAAQLILAGHPETLYDEQEKEFDRIVNSHRKRTRIIRWACSFAACAAVAICLGFALSKRDSCDYNGLEIAQGIEHIMSLGMENVESVTAIPNGNNIILKAVMTDGSQCSFIMSKEAGTQTLLITAMANIN